MTLFDLQQGERGIISKVRGRGAFRKRIIEMGFVVGKEVIVGKKAPLKNPIEYTVMGYNVSLRNSEAKLIEVTSPENIKEEKHYNGVIADDTLKISKYHKKEINIALIGNPNCGKTTLFNHASHSHEKVGNYSGVTVDAKQASFKHKGFKFNLVDLPGTYSITSYSPEELFVRNYLIDQVPDIVINVIDSSNLERNLYLTTQLIDLDIKVVTALNMYDELKKKGDKFNYGALGKMIGIPIIPTVCSKGKGLKDLFDKIIEVYLDKEPSIRHIHINYGTEIEKSIKRLQSLISQEKNRILTNVIAPRFTAIKLLEQDEEEKNRVNELCYNAEEILKATKEEIIRIEDHYKDSTETIITDYKYGFIDGALKETYKESKKDIRVRSRFIDNILTNKILSYPIFIFFMWVMFQTTYTVGAYPMEWLELLVANLGDFVSGIMPDSILKDLIVDGVIGGVGGVIVFLPNILILFFFISIMEDTGYMARVAFIVDKIMHKIGLHGRSFIPMIMGFGCNVPAIMATRTIGGRNDRLVTMLINPFMSCSARLPVYVLIIGTFFPERPGLMLFTIYGIGILLSIIIAIIFKKTLFKSKEMPFVMELPPYRMPTTKAIFSHTWFKGSQYLKKMGGVILVASIIIWALGYFPKSKEIDKQFEHKAQLVKQEYEALANINSNRLAQDSIQTEKLIALNQVETNRLSAQQENSFIGRIGHFIEPAMLPLGFDWKMSISLLAGIAGKEVVVSTLGVLYHAEIDDEENTKDLSSKLKEATYSHPKRAGEKVFTRVSAFSFLVFILIYFPCVAVIAAIKKESGGWKWALFMAVYTTTLAYVLALTVYQIGNLIA